MANKSTVSNESSILNETTLSNDSTTHSTTSAVDRNTTSDSAQITPSASEKNISSESEKNMPAPSDNYFAEARMMIRKPVSVVYNAFIDPAVTTNFWFTKSSGKLEKGQTVRWEWEMYNVGDDVRVMDLVSNSKIQIEWGNGSEKSIVQFTFTAINSAHTLVHIKNYGFKGSVDQIISQVRDSTGGFTTVLDGLKGFLEYGINLNLILDKFPQESGSR